MMASLTSLHPKMQNTTNPMLQLIPKLTTIDMVGGILCNICHLTFAKKKDYDSHYITHGNVTDIIYTCNICFKDIVGYPSFRGHCYTNHVIKDRFKCEHCMKQFSKLSILKEHINIVHKFKCPSCNKEFPTKKEVLLHQIIHSDIDQPPYNCNTCKKNIKTADECKTHVEMHFKAFHYCPICSDHIPAQENAINHIKKHYGDEINDEGFSEKEMPKSSEETYIEQIGGIFCELCSAILKNRVEFDAHFSCEHGDEDIVYMCVVCGNTFEKYSAFANHCYNHSMKNRYECQNCQKSFPRPSLLAMHSVACEAGGEGGERGAGGAGAGEAGKVFACTVCGHRFHTAGRWREHLRDAHALTRLPCPRAGCHHMFDTPKELILHQQSHDDTIRHYCNQCRVLMKNATSAEFHMDMHKKKVYFCPICNRNYKEKYKMMAHVPQHFETTLHICKVCGKVCNARRRFLDHMKTHSNVKTYACKQCDKTFTKPSHLQQHINIHTGTKPYKCAICSKTFASYPNWHKHTRRMHHEESIHIKNPIIDKSESVDDEANAKEAPVDEEDEISTDNTKDDNDEFSNTDEQVSSVDDQMSTDTITNITMSSDNAHCLSDIGDANASIDFANVRLETYIFNENVGSIEVDHIPAISNEKDLFNENSSGNTTIPANLFDGNNAIVEDLFNGAGELKNSLVDKFNVQENITVGKDLFQANVDEAPNPDDILEYIAEMPENNSLFVPVIDQEPLGPSCVQASVEAGAYPCEYGPEFNNGLAATSSGFVNLDDHIMPHIDPLLTIKNETCNKMYVQMQNNPQHYDYNVTVETTDYENVPKWEPPIITKLYDEYAYGLGDIADAGRLSIMNTDIF